MKTKIALLLSIIILSGGCDWIKGLAEVDIPTDLMLDIPVTVSGEKSASYFVSKDLILADNQDIEPYLEKLRKITLDPPQVTVYGLIAGQTITSMTLEADGVGTLFTQTNITSASNSFNPQVDGEKLLKAGEKLKNEKKLTLILSGTTSGPMVFTVNLIFPTVIVAGALD